jgi:hypothetical protein
VASDADVLRGYASDPFDDLRSVIPGRSTRRRSRAERSTQELFKEDEDIGDPPL